jgi:hypothetical protein
LHYAHTDLRRRNKATYLQDQENDRNNLNENIERNNLGNEVWLSESKMLGDAVQETEEWITGRDGWNEQVSRKHHRES